MCGAGIFERALHIVKEVWRMLEDEDSFGACKELLVFCSAVGYLRSIRCPDVV